MAIIAGVCAPTQTLGQACFSQKRTITTTAIGAISVFVADLDGDGDMDVLSASVIDDTIAWWENDGAADPTFTKRVITTTADAAFSVFAVDVDGDGDMDVLSASRADNTIAWYENNGAADPVFTKRLITTTAAGAISVFAADMDGDGDTDVLSASDADHTIAWYENDGAAEPTFTKRVITTTAIAAESVFAADVDGDGDTDVLSASVADNTIAWYENNGAADPAFIKRVITTTTLGPDSVFAADVDGDGDTDVLSTSLDDTVAWWENDGAAEPTFTKRVITTSAEAADSVFAADVDGDGDTDVLSASTGDHTIAWYENDGAADPTFTKRVLTATADGARSVFAADVDGDGEMDVLSASSRDNTIAWWENARVVNRVTGAGFRTFAAAIDAASTGQTLIADPWLFRVDCTPVLDFAGKAITIESAGSLVRDAATETTMADGATLRSSPLSSVRISGPLGIPDGASSMIIGNDAVELTGLIHFGVSGSLLNAGGRLVLRDRASFTERVIAPNDGFTTSIIPADVDGDGDTDILSVTRTNSDNTIAWWENDGAADPVFTIHVVTTTADTIRSVFVTDVDGDGDADILSLSFLKMGSGASKIAWRENSGGTSPSFTEHVLVITMAVHPIFDISATDVDGDGDTDILSATRTNSDSTIAWWENDGAADPTFTRRVIKDSTTGFFGSVVAADVDGDGDSDILTSSEIVGGYTIAWWKNDGATNPAFTKHTITTVLAVNDIVTADVDGDGDTDILTTTDSLDINNNDRLAWWENDGAADPTFTRHIIKESTNEGLGSIVATDIDGDGDKDILSAVSTPFSIRSNGMLVWWENDGAADPAFTQHVITTIFHSPICMADMDGDGDKDILSTFAVKHAMNSSLVWLENNQVAAIALSVGSSLESTGDVAFVNRSVSVPASAALVAAGGLSVDKTSALSGSGVARALIVASAGVVAPDVSAPDAAAPLTIEGGYLQRFNDGVIGDQAGDLVIDLTDGSAWGRLNVTGAAVLAGGLRATAGAGFDPPVGARFEFLTAASLTDRFDVAFLPGLTGGRFLRVEYSAGTTQAPGASVALVVDSLTERGVDLDSPQSATVNGLPSGAALGDVAGRPAAPGGTPTGPDGLLDLVLTIPDPQAPNVSPGSVVILINGGNANGLWRGFSGGTIQLTTGVNPSALAIGDIDNDKDLDDDIVVVDEGDNTAQPIRNDGAGMFSVLPPIALPFAPMDVALSDVDGDFRLDIVAVGTDTLTGGFLATALNQSGFLFAAPVVTGAGTDPIAMAIGDLDNDKNLDDDVVVADAGSGAFVVFENTGGGLGPAWGGFAQRASVTVGTAPVDVALRDLDNDGDLDVVTADRNSDTVSIALGRLGVSFTPATGLPVGDTPVSITAADLDGDGDADLGVVVNAPAGSVNTRVLRVLRNDLDPSNGQLVFASPVDVATPIDPLFALAGNVDNLAGEDLVAVGAAPAQAGGRTALIAPRLGGASAVTAESCVADVNEDGRVDGVDLAFVLNAFGEGGAGAQLIAPAADLTGDGAVDGQDLAAMLQGFGPCP